MFLHNKEDRPRVAALRRSEAGFCPKTIAELSYHNSAKSASPNLPRRGGVLSMTWELALMTIGTGWLIRQLFRLIDKIET